MVTSTPSATSPSTVATDESIHPFQFHATDEALVDLRRRIAVTNWPESELVTDPSQGVQLATMQRLASFWETEHDWRKVEARLNALPQFMTNIDGLNIHFIHVGSNHPDALPVIITHGWPGSIIEQLKIIEPLANPTASGGDASDAFDVVIPSLPGHGFSGKPTVMGWDPQRVARAWTGTAAAQRRAPVVVSVLFRHRTWSLRIRAVPPPLCETHLAHGLAVLGLRRAYIRSHVDIVHHNYRWRLGLADGEHRYDEVEARLAVAPVISVPTITLESDANGVPHPNARAYAQKFVGKYEHRVIAGGIGHNLPKEAPQE